LPAAEPPAAASLFVAKSIQIVLRHFGSNATLPPSSLAGAHSSPVIAGDLILSVSKT